MGRCELLQKLGVKVMVGEAAPTTNPKTFGADKRKINRQTVRLHIN